MSFNNVWTYNERSFVQRCERQQNLKGTIIRKQDLKASLKFINGKHLC